MDASEVVGHLQFAHHCPQTDAMVPSNPARTKERTHRNRADTMDTIRASTMDTIRASTMGTIRALCTDFAPFDMGYVRFRTIRPAK
jgi:hypothetical protein